MWIPADCVGILDAKVESELNSVVSDGSLQVAAAGLVASCPMLNTSVRSRTWK